MFDLAANRNYLHSHTIGTFSLQRVFTSHQRRLGSTGGGSQRLLVLAGIEDRFPFRCPAYADRSVGQGRRQRGWAIIPERGLDLDDLSSLAS